MSSFIYKNITFYRAIMQVLYAGKYFRRFDPVKKILKDNKIKSVFELCFGDTVIAEYCRKNGIEWKGVDGNETFVVRAKRMEFKAEMGHIHSNMEFVQADAVIMMGSLYHFKEDAFNLVKKSLENSKFVIINEPIKSYAQHKTLGKAAAQLSNAGKGAENFRFDRKTLVALADSICTNSLYSYKIVHEGEKDMTLLFERG